MMMGGIPRWIKFTAGLILALAVISAPVQMAAGTTAGATGLYKAAHSLGIFVGAVAEKASEKKVTTK